MTATTAAPAPQVLAETVGLAVRGAAYTHSLHVSPGDPVEFETAVPATVPTSVTLTVTRTSRRTWSVTAAALGQRSTAQISGTPGAAIMLTDLHYRCALPPQPSVCPARRVDITRTGYSLAFSTSGAKILVGADVGPIPGEPAVSRRHASSLVVPPYGLVENLTAFAPDTSLGRKAHVYSATATAAPGDTVILATHLEGRPIGAPQPVTVSFDQGPAPALRISASLPGGRPSVATLSSTSGQPIELLLPVYYCDLPPRPTFCPALTAKASDRHYTITFASTPGNPIELFASAQTG
jgi:hypothetical protein